MTGFVLPLLLVTAPLDAGLALATAVFEVTAVIDGKTDVVESAVTAAFDVIAFVDVFVVGRIVVDLGVVFVLVPSVADGALVVALVVVAFVVVVVVVVGATVVVVVVVVVVVDGNANQIKYLKFF